MSTFDALSTLPVWNLVQLGLVVIQFALTAFMVGHEVGRRRMWKYHLRWIAERRKLLGLED